VLKCGEIFIRMKQAGGTAATPSKDIVEYGNVLRLRNVLSRPAT
jgi:hypothetical protein